VPESSPAIALIEPNLRQPSGHYLEFVRALGSAVPAGHPGYRVIAPARAKAFLAEVPGVIWAAESVDPGGRMRSEWSQIARLLRRRAPFLVLTAKAKHALWASLCRRLLGTPLDRAGFYFHWREDKPLSRSLLACARAARREALTVVPTPGIAEGYTAAGWQHLETVPYPMLAEECPAPAPACAHLLMAGAARLNKGLDLLTGLVERWSAQPPPAAPVIQIQLSPKHHDRQGRLEAGLADRLRAARYPHLHINPNAPDRPGYLQQFHGALVLAPYDPVRFHHAVSGVVLDALLCGAPVIASANTWAGDLVARFGAGSVLADRSVAGLDASIRQVLADWPAVAARAQLAARALAAEHHPVHLHTVLERLRGERVD